jgi:DNA-binding response OmpR family regulator
VSTPAILLVEDNPQTSRLFHKVLFGVGYTVHSALTLHEAHSLLRQHTFALLVLDLHMPDGSGLEFLQKYSSALEQHGTKILVISAEDYRAECHHIGIHLYLDKPILPSSLTNIVQQLLGGRLSENHRSDRLSEFVD